MIYLIEILKGVLLCFGIILGFVISIALILNKAKKEEKSDPDDLIKPFEDYLEKIRDDEHYEEIVQVEKIISELKSGKVINDLFDFRIKKEKSVQLNDESGKTELKILTKYTVMNKIKVDNT